MELKTRGFALSSRPQGEADRWVRFFTLHAGLIRSSVRGVRKQGGKLAASLELFTESDLVLNRKGSGDFNRLTQAKVLSSHADLKKTLPSISILQVFSEVLEQSLPDGEAHPEIYALVLESLDVLGESKDGSDRERVLASLVLHLLDQLGYPLELARCVECGASLTRTSAVLVPHRGGAQCPDCSPGSSGLRLSPSARAVVEKLREWPIRRALVLKTGPDVSRGVFKTVLGYLERTLENPMKAFPYYLQVVGLKRG